MPINCPCCKAVNDTGPTCRRCKADLTLLFVIEEQRTALLTAARHLAAESRFPQSLATLERAAQLRHGEDIAQLRSAVLLLARDFPAALSAYDDSVSIPKHSGG